MAGRAFPIPDNVEQDIFKTRVAVVAVRAPAVAVQVNFHVAGTRRSVADLDDGAAKIRAAFGAGEPGMEHADGFPVRCLQLVAPQPLMPPDGLEQPLGGPFSFIAQDAGDATPGAPAGIKIFGRCKHRKLAFAPVPRQSQDRCANI